ncbi:hypothetical protein EH165_14140 [Nakamurella antarctica]|uniref:Uncharacterized protein n=1 Tax=Nakamurella antarctica TaxID=1902245 RepID=A0A3G8ZPB2_9ACTN|nr:hypothetical protein [Nakamurella antarctica]AZI59110.1 hypothetical protein EH165_14140 [Nakamurella antarctica]
MILIFFGAFFAVGGITFFNKLREATVDLPATQSPIGVAPAPLTSTVPVPITPVGQAAVVQVGQSSLSITVDGAMWQPGARWGESVSGVSDGHLVLQVAASRTDTASGTERISWIDWSFAADDGSTAAQAELTGGGYEPYLNSISLAAGENVGGNLSFATKATSGVVSLRRQNRLVATFEVTSERSVGPLAAVNVPATSPVGAFPFSVDLSQPQWRSASDPNAGGLAPANGSWLWANYTASLVDPGGAAGTIRYDSWRFLPDGGGEFVGKLGVIDGGAATATQVAGAEASTGRFTIDTVAGPGTLQLINKDGSVVISWVVAGP